LLVKSFVTFGNISANRTITLRKQVPCKWSVIVPYLVINSNSRFSCLVWGYWNLKVLKMVYELRRFCCVCASILLRWKWWCGFSYLGCPRCSVLKNPLYQNSEVLSLSVVVQIDKNLISQNAIVLFKQVLLLVPTIIGKLPFCGDATVWSACEEGVGKAT